MLLDADDRVLLLEHVISEPPGAVWVPPGGGAEPGESFAEAARRELWEETGLSVEAIGPLLWVRKSILPVAEDQLTTVIEHFFLCRIVRHEIGEHLNIDELERAAIRSHMVATAGNREGELAFCAATAGGPTEAHHCRSTTDRTAPD